MADNASIDKGATWLSTTWITSPSACGPDADGASHDPPAGDAYVNVESVIDHHAELPPGVDAFRTWFEVTTRSGDHWMSWDLRARSLPDLEAVAERLGGEVVTSPGARRPDSTISTTIMARGARRSVGPADSRTSTSARTWSSTPRAGSR